MDGFNGIPMQEVIHQVELNLLETWSGFGRTLEIWDDIVFLRAVSSVYSKNLVFGTDGVYPYQKQGWRA